MQIKNKDGSVIFSDDSATLKQTVENAVKSNVSLFEADLSGADLLGANLSKADLRWADLSKADLRWANLRGTNLYEANLSKANLTDADLRGADLCGADLSGADLTEAKLRGADLRGANLSGANLTGADFWDANLREADLRGTCLDPASPLPSLDLGNDAAAFATNAKTTENDPGFLYGWRTAKSSHCTTKGVYVTYEPGCEYVAPWFSVADTECHPGLYLAPSIEWLENNDYEGPFVMVKALKSETIKAGEKYRCKRFWVL